MSHIWYILFTACIFTLFGFVVGFRLGEENASRSPRDLQGPEE
jgi:hypothetical protein